MNTEISDQILDCYGLLCPVPVIRGAQRIGTARIGEKLEIISED